MRLPLALLPAILVLLQATGAWAQPLPPVDYPPFDAAACVAKPQRLLIIDMKSGWWSGDGGDFHNALLPRIVKDCKQVEIEYYFMQYVDPAAAPGLPTIPGVPLLGAVGFLSFYPEKPGVQNESLMVLENFPSRPWTEYQQVWLLSGGDHDPTDWPTDSPAFQSLLAKFTTPAATPAQSVPSYFFAGGLGHRDHANHVLQAFQLPEMFQSHVTELITPRFGDGSQIEVFSRARIGAELTTNAVFDGVGSIADRVDIFGEECDTDFLPVANHPFQIVGRNRLGEPSIAVRETDNRRWVLDGGMPRYYSVFDPTERDTYRYLQNTIKWLAK